MCRLFSSPLSLDTNSWLWLREMEVASVEDICKVRKGRDPLSSIYIGIDGPTEARLSTPISKNQSPKQVLFLRILRACTPQRTACGLSRLVALTPVWGPHILTG